MQSETSKKPVLHSAKLQNSPKKATSVVAKTQPAVKKPLVKSVITTKSDSLNNKVRPVIMQRYGAWAVYKYPYQGQTLYYTLGAPVESLPANPARGTYFLISNRPKAKKTAVFKKDINLLEPQFISTVELLPSSSVQLNVISHGKSVAQYNMYVKQKYAWLLKADQERELINYLRKGATLEVRTTDKSKLKRYYRFSLIGIQAALNVVGKSH